MSQKYNVYFKYSGHYDTKSVEVVGDFNNWERGNCILEDDDGDNTWWGETALSSGVYHYKFLVDGEHYHLDANNPLRAYTEGFENSVIEVGEARLKGDFVHDPETDIDFFNEHTFYIRIAVNHRNYSNVRLILVIDDFIKTVLGYEQYRDDVYAYIVFKIANGINAQNLHYYFEADKKENGSEYFGANGIVGSEWEALNFEYKCQPCAVFKTPDWVKDAVFYQIFPERFFNGDPKISPPGAVSPDTLPSYGTFYGGDLEGVIKKIGHMKELGVNAIYFNPIFEAGSTHKYDASDYMKVDPHFGDDAVFARLKDTLRANGMRFILDAVFNHTGTGFWAFRDIEKNGEQSKYFDWYFVHKLPLTENGKANYTCWWNFASLPKLNADNPETRAYLLDVAKTWIERGSNGWRLDVPNEIEHPFWKEFRQVVKTADPDAYIVGEIWRSAKDWLKGDEFDAVMNYRFRDACIEFFAQRKISSKEFIRLVGDQLRDYPMQVNFALMNLLSSHDTARFFTVARLSEARVLLAAVFQFTYLGAPSVYYGEETGMEGGKDPDNRRFMVWDKKRWHTNLFEAYRRLIRIRNENPVLRNGDIRFFNIKNSTFGFERFNGEDRLYIFINNSNENINIDITHYAGNGDFVDIFKNYPLKRKRAFTLYANDFVILKKVKERD